MDSILIDNIADPSGKKPEDELKGAAVMKDDVEGAKEDKEEMKGTVDYGIGKGGMVKGEMVSL